MNMNAQDRCDSNCNAQAYVSVVFATGGQLMFCGHHYDKVKDTLGPNASVIEDTRPQLTAV